MGLIHTLSTMAHVDNQQYRMSSQTGREECILNQHVTCARPGTLSSESYTRVYGGLSALERVLQFYGFF